MAQILIRNLDDFVLDGLRQRARARGGSTEAEARRILTTSVNSDVQSWLAQLDAVRAANGAQSGPTSLDLLREDRARDDDA
jgi:plasmid stability protein